MKWEFDRKLDSVLLEKDCVPGEIVTTHDRRQQRRFYLQQLQPLTLLWKAAVTGQYQVQCIYIAWEEE